MFKGLRTLLLRATEVLSLFVAVIVLVYILLGEDSGLFVLGVIGNLTLLIAAISPQTLIAVALVVCMMLLLRARGPKP